MKDEKNPNLGVKQVYFGQDHTTTEINHYCFPNNEIPVTGFVGLNDQNATYFSKQNQNLGV